MRFEFARSKIWEGAGDVIDESEAPVVVKVQGGGEKAERKARARLPDPGLGRNWILVGKKE